MIKAGYEMIVTAVTPVDKRRCKVFLEEGFALILYRGEIRRYRIEEGSELTEEQYEEILHSILFRRARERVVYLLKSSDKTERELRRKLLEGCYPEEAIQYAVDFCKKCHYIDDESYVVRYIESNASRKSRKQISYELQQKGIGREQIAQAFEDCPCDEEEQVRKLLEKKHYDREQMDMKEKQRLRAYLMRKGFSGEIISRVMGRNDDWD